MEQTNNISNRLTDYQLLGAFINAFEQGSSYWCSISQKSLAACRETYKTEEKPCASEYVWEAILAGESVTFYDVEDPSDTWVLTLEKVKEGTEKFAKEHPQHYADALTEQGDATTDDVWFQMCLLGELVFG